MNRFLGMLLWMVLAIGIHVLLPHVAWSFESKGQERLAYYELTRIRSLSKPGITYREYRDALVRPREYVGLLTDGSSETVGLLRKAMGYYNQALDIWGLEAVSDFPVDSLRTDEPHGAAILKECPNISRFHYKERDQIYVLDAVDCLWNKAADVLGRVPADLH